MLNLLRKFLRPTLREQLEDGVREALRRYADRRVAPDLRVYVSTDLLPERVEPALWARDEGDHLRRFALQWAQDNGIGRAGLRIEVILLDTKRQFAFVKPVGLSAPAPEAAAPAAVGASSRPMVPQPPITRSGAAAPSPAGRGGALLEVVNSPTLQEPVRVQGEVIVGRRSQEGVLGLGDRYMSSRHARLRAESGRLWVTDLDSKNRTYVNDQPLPPHQAHEVSSGDTLRLGTTVLRVGRLGS
jgi:hypothetical protein